MEKWSLIFHIGPMGAIISKTIFCDVEGGPLCFFYSDVINLNNIYGKQYSTHLLELLIKRGRGHWAVLY